jgi:hypothetical protein
VLAGGSALAMTGDRVAVPLRGNRVPAKATCSSPLKLVTDAARFAFASGAERAERRKLEQCFSCMGQGVQDVTLLATAVGAGPFPDHARSPQEGHRARASISATTSSSLPASRPAVPD